MLNLVQGVCTVRYWIPSTDKHKDHLLPQKVHYLAAQKKIPLGHEFS